GPIVVGAHMHVYETKAEGERQKAGYEIWEYGAKPGVPFSRYGGDVEDALTAMRHAGYAHAVTVNMFAPELARAEALATLPPGADQARARAQANETMGDRLRASNRCDCAGAE